MNSSRLPGKVLKKAGGVSLLEHQIKRVSSLDIKLYVATTLNQIDDPIEKLCNTYGVICFRGSEDDVLSRFYNIALSHGLDLIVRITSDCPLIDPNLILEGVEKALAIKEWQISYVSNCIKRTFPRGFDFEVFSFKMLSEAHKKGVRQEEKEHVTLYFYNNIKRFNFVSIEGKKDFSKYRVTVDTIEDFELVKLLIENFGAENKNAQEISEILESNPALNKINAHIEQKKV